MARNHKQAQTLPPNNITAVCRALPTEPNLEFAVLLGSRADNRHTSSSDWDIALQWQKNMNWLMQLSRTEPLRHNLASALALPANARSHRHPSGSLGNAC